MGTGFCLVKVHSRRRFGLGSFAPTALAHGDADRERCPESLSDSHRGKARPRLRRSGIVMRAGRCPVKVRWGRRFCSGLGSFAPDGARMFRSRGNSCLPRTNPGGVKESSPGADRGPGKRCFCACWGGKPRERWQQKHQSPVGGDTPAKKNVSHLRRSVFHLQTDPAPSGGGRA
jgi:hypothetical protein